MIILLLLFWQNKSGFSFPEFLKSQSVFAIISLTIVLFLSINNPMIHKQVDKMYIWVLLTNCYLIIAQYAFSQIGVLLFYPGQRYLSGWEIRPCGLFMEPAHFAAFSFGYLILKVKLSKKHLYNNLLVIFALVISKSLIGYIVLTFVIIKIIITLIKIKRRLGLILVILMTITSSIVIRDTLVTFFDKMVSTQNLSTVTRVYQGYEMYKYLPADAKIFGLGLGNIRLAVRHYYGDYQTLFSEQEEASNGFFYDFLAFGFPLTIIIKIFSIIIFTKASYGVVFYLLLEILRNGAGISVLSNIYLVILLLVISRGKSDALTEIISGSKPPQ